LIGLRHRHAGQQKADCRCDDEGSLHPTHFPNLLTGSIIAACPPTHSGPNPGGGVPFGGTHRSGIKEIRQ
jgi:hypothetical protein